MVIRPEQCSDDRPARSTDRPDRQAVDGRRPINPFDLPFDDDYVETFYQNRVDDTPRRNNRHDARSAMQENGYRSTSIH